MTSHNDDLPPERVGSAKPAAAAREIARSPNNVERAAVIADHLSHSKPGLHLLILTVGVNGIRHWSMARVGDVRYMERREHDE